jgi:hypothetical protein
MGTLGDRAGIFRMGFSGFVPGEAGEVGVENDITLPRSPFPKAPVSL